VNREEQHDRQCAHLTIAILLALSFWLMGELKFLIPYKAVLIHAYGTRFHIPLCYLRISFRSVRINRRFFLRHRQKTFASRQQMQIGAGNCPAPSIDTMMEITRNGLRCRAHIHPRNGRSAASRCNDSRLPTPQGRTERESGPSVGADSPPRPDETPETPKTEARVVSLVSHTNTAAELQTPQL